MAKTIRKQNKKLNLLISQPMKCLHLLNQIIKSSFVKTPHRKGDSREVL